MRVKTIIPSVHFRNIYLLVIWLCTTCLAHAQKTRSPESLFYDSAFNYLFTDQQKCIAFGEKCLALSKKSGNYNQEGLAYNVIGNAYHVQGNYVEAFKRYNQALRIFEKRETSRGLITTYVNLGYLHADQYNYAMARKNYRLGIQKSLEIKDSANLSNLYNNMGATFVSDKQPDSALRYHFAALNLREKLGRKDRIAGSLSNIGAIYFEKGDYDKSMEYNLRALKMDSLNAPPFVYINLSGAYKFDGNPDKALYYAKKALAIGEHNIEKYLLVDLYIHLYGIYGEKKNYELSLLYADKALKLKDSLAREETKRIVSETAEKYESEKKELKIQNLNKQKTIDDAELQKQSVQKIAFAVGFVFLLVFFVFLYRGYRQKQKANQEILYQKQVVETQAHELAERQKEIIDSIHYAKRIQEAYLPPEKTFNHIFPDGFLFFKPKDLVSGDFYWFYTGRDEQGRLTDEVFFAVADCTGHGVPGALMSMICCNALNEVVVNQKNTDPGKILDMSREIIIRNMKSQAGSGQKDGMDIALCKLNSKTGQLWYAGANNPLWILRKNVDAYQMEEINPDKQPVGIFEKLDDFTVKTIQLNNGDRIYAFSDGYADQFGLSAETRAKAGAILANSYSTLEEINSAKATLIKGKKFKYSNFKELLIESAAMDMQAQGHLLAKKLEEWKGDLEQVDDVCVMGIKFNA